MTERAQGQAIIPAGAAQHSAQATPSHSEFRHPIRHAEHDLRLHVLGELPAACIQIYDLQDQRDHGPGNVHADTQPM